MILDYIAGSSLIFLCAVCSLLHYISSPKRGMWFTPPEHFRTALLTVAAMFLWRGVNFFSQSPTATLGHINAVGVMSFISLVGLGISAMAWTVPARLKAHAWERLRWIFWELHHNPNLRPILVTNDEITDIAHAVGQAAVGAGEPPSAVGREGPRYLRSVARNSRRPVAATLDRV